MREKQGKGGADSIPDHQDLVFQLGTEGRSMQEPRNNACQGMVKSKMSETQKCPSDSEKGESSVNWGSLKRSCGMYARLCRKNTQKKEELHNGGRIRRGDHLPPHKYIRNTSTCGTTPTEHLLNAGRRPQTSQKARNSPTYLGGQKKKEKTETKE